MTETPAAPQDEGTDARTELDMDGTRVAVDNNPLFAEGWLDDHLARVTAETPAPAAAPAPTRQEALDEEPCGDPYTGIGCAKPGCTHDYDRWGAAPSAPGQDAEAVRRAAWVLADADHSRAFRDADPAPHFARVRQQYLDKAEAALSAAGLLRGEPTPLDDLRTQEWRATGKGHERRAAAPEPTPQDESTGHVQEGQRCPRCGRSRDRASRVRFGALGGNHEVTCPHPFHAPKPTVQEGDR